jgi:hypothetical protein
VCLFYRPDWSYCLLLLPFDLHMNTALSERHLL